KGSQRGDVRRSEQRGSAFAFKRIAKCSFIVRRGYPQLWGSTMPVGWAHWNRKSTSENPRLRNGRSWSYASAPTWGKHGALKMPDKNSILGTFVRPEELSWFDFERGCQSANYFEAHVKATLLNLAEITSTYPCCVR